jgi:hypothetical protein
MITALLGQSIHGGTGKKGKSIKDVIFLKYMCQADAAQVDVWGDVWTIYGG